MSGGGRALEGRRQRKCAPLMMTKKALMSTAAPSKAVSNDSWNSMAAASSAMVTSCCSCEGSQGAAGDVWRGSWWWWPSLKNACHERCAGLKEHNVPLLACAGR
jgi:hypothetical protein